MPKQKNIDIWNHYRFLVDQRETAFIDSVTGPVKPSIIYVVYNNGDVRECFVTGFTYCDFYGTRTFYKKRPSEIEIKILIAHYEANPVMVSERVGVNYYYFWTYNDTQAKASSTFMLYDPERNKNLFLTKEEADEYAKAINKTNAEEKAFQELHKKDSSFDYTKAGYRFLGWQNGWKHVYFDENGQQTNDPEKRKTFGYTKEDYPEYGSCIEQKHRRITVHHNNRGSENTVSCPVCKIYWKYDSSD